MFFRETKNFVSVLAFLFIVALFPLAKAHAGKTDSPLYAKAQKCYYELKGSSAKQAYRDHWIQCIDRFLKVYKAEPASVSAYNALFTTARLYHELYQVAKRTSDRDQALHFYYKVISEFKDGRLTDDALFHQGQILKSKKQIAEARASFEKILKYFPEGDQARKAKEELQRTARLAPPKVASRIEIRKQTAKTAALRTLKNIHYVTLDDTVRVVIDTDGPLQIAQNRLHNPDRIYFNFKNSRLDERLDQEIAVPGDILSKLRLSQFDKNTSRLVMDLPSAKGVEVTAQSGVSQVVISLKKPRPKTIQYAKKIKPSPKPKLARTRIVKAVPAAVPPVAKRPVKKGPALIVLDPGHGGKDLGAQGKSGLHEKDVNLKISKRLQRILEKRYGYKVLLTRTDDTFISLERRGEIANENHAKLFVSIHANAAERRSAHGIETYYLGVANSAQAQETAARENGELVRSVQDDQVQQILASLISTTKINDSAQLAGRVQERMHSAMKKKYRGVRDLGVKEGPFFVLHDTNMPSILVEVGFVTNPREEKRLKSTDYLNRLASSIAQGIHQYMKDRGPTI